MPGARPEHEECVYLRRGGKFQSEALVLPGGQFVRGLGVLQEQGVFSGPQILLLILEICLKDEAVPEAPKEGVRVLVHC